MIARWCISAFIFLLTLFGVVSQQQISIPNQEIVLQFRDVDLTSEDAKHTISIVKAQLEALGVENIQVKAQGNGDLKISYYYDADISSIKEIFERKQNLVLDYQSENRNSSKVPIDGNHIAYNINVYEIQSSSYSDWNIDGAFSLEVKVKNDRYLDPNNYQAVGYLDSCSFNRIVKVVFKSQSHISHDIADALHSMPEVRAGPPFS
jgi:hypothetical protein